MTRPYSNDLRERAMARVAAGETIRVVAAALRISPRAFQNGRTPARDRQRVCGADWRPQAACFVGRSRRLAAGPVSSASFTLRDWRRSLPSAA